MFTKVSQINEIWLNSGNSKQWIRFRNSISSSQTYLPSSLNKIFFYEIWTLREDLSKNIDFLDFITCLIKI